MKAEIIAVGTELLLGDVLDTNSRYLSQQLAVRGITLCFRQTVGDNPRRLRDALSLALSRAQVVLLCGGLGPTPDDLTKEIACEVLGVPLVLHEDSLRRMTAYFARTGRSMSENNRKQAMLPQGGTVFPNDNGTAPGCAMEKDGNYVLLFPGPPRELVPMFEQSAASYLDALTDGVLVSHKVHVFGMGESAAAQKAVELLGADNPTVAPYAKDGEMYFRITARAKDAESAHALCAPVTEKLCTLLGDAVYGVDVDTLEQAVVTGLAAVGKTVATAESCTGGLVSQRITCVPGASAVFSCGVCAYSADIKEALLGVSPRTIAQTGTVSAFTAAEMARGVRARGRADYGVSVTGSAGPQPCEGKEVGLVYTALCDGESTYVRTLHLGHHRGDRAYIRTVAASHALDMVRVSLAGGVPGERLQNG